MFVANVLVVDDDETMCAAFRHFLLEEGHVPMIVSNAQDAVQTVSEAHPDLVLMDIRMPGIDGIEALQRLREVDPGVYVVIMTAYGTSQTSIEAMRLGAFDYMTKPLDLDDLRNVIDKALEAQSIRRELHQAPAEDWERYSLVNLIGNNPLMQETYKLIGLLASNDVPALIVGERGVGKQLVAHTIHANSRRKDKPFVVSSPAEEDVLMVIASARGGTIFLESVTEIAAAAQEKVKRYLQEKPETRVIAATDRDVADEIRAGRFNPELYDALRVISIEIPPLRSRKDDIPALVTYFINKSNAELSRNIRGIDDRANQMLSGHDWPGNVAELERVVKRACILARGDVITSGDIIDNFDEHVLPGKDQLEGDLHAAVQKLLHTKLVEGEARPGWSPFHDIVGSVEASLVREALAITKGNQVKAAEILGVNRTTLRKKINPGE
jgi:DNA-binding NtrC family response regulator